MFSYTKKEIIILAQELNVQKQTLERVLRLIDVLEFINTDIFLKDKLVLKGGTAINLTFYDYLRLSVDIDLDYVGSIDKEQMVIDRRIIETKILNYMQESKMQYRSDKTKKNIKSKNQYLAKLPHINKKEMLSIKKAAIANIPQLISFLINSCFILFSLL